MASEYTVVIWSRDSKDSQYVIRQKLFPDQSIKFVIARWEKIIFKLIAHILVEIVTILDNTSPRYDSRNGQSQNFMSLPSEVEESTISELLSFDLFEDLPSTSEDFIILDESSPGILLPTRPFREFVFPLLK
jgi:hypothetical protein